MFSEFGIVETAQIAAWAGAIALGARIAAAPGAGRDRLFASWLCLLAILAMLRELDAHVFLNPETLGEWGVRYRIDWWLDPAAPVGARVLWLAVFVGLVGAIIYPLVRVWPRWNIMLRARDGAFVLLALCAACLVGGYALDDLLGRSRFVPAPYTSAAEEVLELAGAALFAAGMLALLRRPFTQREADAIAARAGRSGRTNGRSTPPG